MMVTHTCRWIEYQNISKHSISVSFFFLFSRVFICQWTFAFFFYYSLHRTSFRVTVFICCCSPLLVVYCVCPGKDYGNIAHIWFFLVLYTWIVYTNSFHFFARQRITRAHKIACAFDVCLYVVVAMVVASGETEHTTAKASYGKRLMHTCNKHGTLNA